MAEVIGSVVVVLVAAACVWLGFWQLDRLEQRRDRNRAIEERIERPAVDFDAVRDPDADLDWRRVRLDGGCEGSQIVLAGRSRRGAPGAHLLCRFRTAGGALVLLDRGWVHSWDARTVADSVWRRAPRDTVLEALLVPFPPGEAEARPTAESARLDDRAADLALEESGPPVMYRLNREQAQAASGTSLPPWYARATGAAAGGGPIPADPPDLGEGSHLSYAVQWFSFATIALVGWIVLMVRVRRNRFAPAPPRSVPPVRD